MLYGTPGAGLLGWSRRYGDTTARHCADRIKKVYEVFGTDGVGTHYGLHGVAMAFGAEMSDPEFSVPAILKHPIPDITDLSILNIDVLSIKKDPNAAKCYETVQILAEELGDEVGCGIGVPGVFTAVSSLLGPQQLMRTLRRNPASVHPLLEFVTEGLLQLVKPFLEMDVPVNIADPVASGSMISKAHFEEFVAPYAKRFVEGCNAIRPFGVGCHICGDITKLLESIAACGFSNVDIDNAVDLLAAKERIGGIVHISGNVAPAGVLLSGTPEQVRDEVKRCFREAWDTPAGFTVSTGCDTPWGTPIENSLAFVSEARKCAKYPLDQKNFA
jgi:uroporphyrinogen decarboxylase